MARLETYVQASLSKTKYFKCKIKQTCDPKCKNDQWAPTSLPRAVTASSMSAGSNTWISSSTCNMKPNTSWCIYLTAELKPHHNHLCNASKFTDAMKFWALSMRNYKTLWRTVLYQGLWYAWWILFNLTSRFTRLLVCYNLQEFWTKNFLQLNNSISQAIWGFFSKSIHNQCKNHGVHATWSMLWSTKNYLFHFWGLQIGHIKIDIESVKKGHWL